MFPVIAAREMHPGHHGLTFAANRNQDDG
jgi:hypothetical protein